MSEGTVLRLIYYVNTCVGVWVDICAVIIHKQRILLDYIDVFDDLHFLKHVVLCNLAVITFRVYMLSVKLLLLISNLLLNFI
jgi:hypothetical protein